MNQIIKNRVLKEANEMLKTKQTIRNIALKYKISKSTVHKDLSERLKKIDLLKYKKIKLIIEEHLKYRHLKGGEVTKQKYKKRYYEKI
ncbi:MAG: stage III sporulation protein D [Firmicutes bacterium]|nr:stage III sporulation protein D [Bacillota bacterium]